MSNIKTPKNISNLEVDFENTDFDTSELESLLSTDINTQPKRINNSSFELIQMSSVLSIVCSIYLLIFILLNLRYVPNFCSTYMSNPYILLTSENNKYLFDYTFSNLHLFSKTLLNINHLILVTIFNYIYYLKNTHHSVNIWSVRLFSFLGIFSLVSLINLTYNYNYTMTFMKVIGLKDNIIYSIYMLFTLGFLFQFNFIQKRSNKSKVYTYVLFSILLNVFVYLVSLFVVSFYKKSHFSDIEKMFMITVVVCKEINSVLFHLNYLLFIFLVKSNLSSFGINIALNSDSEIEDLEKNFKCTL